MLCVMYGYVNVHINWGGVGWGKRSCALAWDVDVMGYVNVHVNWGGVGWGMLMFMCTCVGR